MKPRAVRIPMVDAVVKFDRQPATLVNISRTGALLRVPRPGRIGVEGRLVITHAHTTIEIDARIVRLSTAPAAGSKKDTGFEAGIAFFSPPPPEITALLRRVISLG